jgi:hypothetical protein
VVSRCWGVGLADALSGRSKLLTYYPLRMGHGVIRLCVARFSGQRGAAQPRREAHQPLVLCQPNSAKCRGCRNCHCRYALRLPWHGASPAATNTPSTRGAVERGDAFPKALRRVALPACFAEPAIATFPYRAVNVDPAMCLVLDDVVVAPGTLDKSHAAGFLCDSALWRRLRVYAVTSLIPNAFAQSEIETSAPRQRPSPCALPSGLSRIVTRKPGSG